MKRDDETPALGVPAVRAVTATDDDALVADSDELDPLFGIPARDLSLFNAYWHELAMLASEDPRAPTPDEQARANELYEFGVEVMSMSDEELRASRARRRGRG